jgi:hypothetical protein
VSTEGSHELRIHVGQGTELTKKDTMRFIQAVRHAALGAKIMAAALGIAALVLPMTQIASASTAAQPARDHGPKPSIVLVHGAWADSSSWDAFAPAKGQTIGQLVSAQPGSCVLPSANVIAQAYPGAPKGAVDLYVKQSVFPSCMANGLPLGEARTLSATQRPLTSLALTVPSGTPAWKTIHDLRPRPRHLSHPQGRQGHNLTCFPEGTRRRDPGCRHTLRPGQDSRGIRRKELRWTSRDQ